MANLLNALPQAPASNNTISPADRNSNPAKADAKELKNLFQQKLSENIASDLTQENPELVAEQKDLAEVALAAGAMAQQPKAIDLKVAGVKVDQTAKGAELLGAGAGIQVQNQLQTAAPVKANVESIKNAKSQAVQTAMVKGATNQEQQQVVKGLNQPVNAELATAMAGQDLMLLAGDQEMDVESLDLKNSDVKDALPKAASSKLSTSDFLNLREISQNQKINSMNAAQPALTDAAKLAPLPATGAVVMGMKPTQKQDKAKTGKDELSAAMAGLAPAHGAQNGFGKVMDATVSQTHGQKPVLSPESMTQIGNQVSLLGQAKQDGEIKIRLRPDHLGELQMSVRTQGQNVSVQIKAENNEAKKIIEDSLSSLREHLSQQNLSLARIDVVTQPTMSSGADQTQMQFDSSQNFNHSSANADRQNAQDGSQQSRREFYREEPSFGTSQPTSMVRPRTTDSSRLDMIA